MGKLSWIDIGVVTDSIDSVISSPSGKSDIFKNIKVVTKQMAREIAEELRDTIYSYASYEFTPTQASIFHIIENMEVVDGGSGEDGMYYFELTISGELTRPSLGPNDGADDIVGLFIKGWSPKKKLKRPLVGLWHGMTVAARTSKPGMGFAKNAIDDFNSRYPGTAYAVLSSEYM